MVAVHELSQWKMAVEVNILETIYLQMTIGDMLMTSYVHKNKHYMATDTAGKANHGHNA